MNVSTPAAAARSAQRAVGERITVGYLTAGPLTVEPHHSRARAPVRRMVSR